jgi:flavin reductase
MMGRGEFIDAMRRVASIVTVVTTDGPEGRHGATVSAFASVSADPPSVLVCLKADSRIARMVGRNRVFCVNVLRDSDERTADLFAGRLQPEAGDHFAGIALAESAYRPPVLAASACAFSCDIAEAMPFGSHVIIIGHVREVRRGAAMPLTYLDGAYGSVSAPFVSVSSEVRPCR